MNVGFSCVSCVSAGFCCVFGLCEYRFCVLFFLYNIYVNVGWFCVLCIRVGFIVFSVLELSFVVCYV